MMRELKTPDFTPEAICALVSTFLGDVYVLFGTALSPDVKGAITGIATTLVLVAFLIHSAVIRSARARHLGAAQVDDARAYVAPE